MNFQEGISMQFSFSLKNFLHVIWCKELSIFKPCYRLKTYIISCRLKFLGCLHVWAILMIPQVILLDEGVNVTSLFDLHSNRQESGINERLFHLYTCPICFFIFRLTTATLYEHELHSKLKECFMVWNLGFGCWLDFCVCLGFFS